MARKSVSGLLRTPIRRFGLRTIYCDRQFIDNGSIPLGLIIIIIIINCNWVVTRWQWLFYMYAKYEIGYK